MRRSIAGAHILAVLACAAVGCTSAVPAQQPVSFRTVDGWTIHADRYGSGEHAVVLVHGGRFTKESWSPQARLLVQAGFRVLAIDMRGFGASRAGPPSLDPGFGSPLDVLAGVRHLREEGARTISVIGASMGADAAAGASIEADPGEIDHLVLLAGSAGEPPAALKGRKLFVVTELDANAAGLRLPRIRHQFEAAGDPKELLVLEGDAHAQYIFRTDQSSRLMSEILRFLSQ